MYRGTNLYLRKFWYFWPKLSQVQICSRVRVCWRMVRFVSCHAMGKMADKMAFKCIQHTRHVERALFAQAFVFG